VVVGGVCGVGGLEEAEERAGHRFVVFAMVVVVVVGLGWGWGIVREGGGVVVPLGFLRWSPRCEVWEGWCGTAVESLEEGVIVGGCTCVLAAPAVSPSFRAVGDSRSVDLLRAVVVHAAIALG